MRATAQRKVRGQVVLDPAERLMSLSIPEPNSGCWIWLGATKRKPPAPQYGSIIVGSRTDGTRRSTGAHRYSVEVFKGETIPDGAEICHRCDTPLCINPDHLWVGSKVENSFDRAKKGRDPKGEQVHNAKLTWAKVAEIRESTLGYKKLARLYGVDPSVIKRVRRGTSWKLPQPPEPRS